MGLPEGFEIRSAKSTGMTIIGALTDQIGGTIRATTGKGAIFTIEFPLNNEGEETDSD